MLLTMSKFSLKQIQDYDPNTSECYNYAKLVLKLVVGWVLGTGS